MPWTYPCKYSFTLHSSPQSPLNPTLLTINQKQFLAFPSDQIKMSANTTIIPLMETYKGLTVVVPIGEVGNVNFSTMPTIGTDYLNGGTVVILACPSAAIMAHIPRLPPSPSDNALQVSMEQLQPIMNEIAALFASLQADGRFREQETVTKLMAAQDCNDELQAPYHIIKIHSELRTLGLTTTICPYNLPENTSSNSSVMVVSLDLGHCQEQPKLYLSDEIIEWE